MAAIVARSLGAGGFGAYSVATWMVATASFVATFGFSSAGVKYVAQASQLGAAGQPSTYAKFMLRRVVPWSAATSLVMLGLAGLASEGVPFGPTPAALVIVAIAVPLGALTVLVNAFLLGSERFGTAALVQTAGVIGLALLTATASFRPSVETFVIAVAVASLITSVGGLLACKRSGLLTGGGDLEAGASRGLMSYSAVVFVIAAAEVIVWSRSEVLVLGLTRSVAEAGLYASSFAIVSGVADVLPRAIGVTLFPSLSAHAADRVRFRRALQGAVSIVGVLSLALGIVLILAASDILETIYGPEFAGGDWVLAGLALTSAVATIGGIAASGLFALDRQRTVLGVTLAGAGLNLTADLLLIPPVGLLGAVLANGISQIMVAVGLVSALVRSGDLSPSTLALLGRTLIACAVAGAGGIAAQTTIAGVGPRWVVVAVTVVVSFALGVAAFESLDRGRFRAAIASRAS